MGCDIHMYIEYKRKNTTTNNWNNFGSKINPGRNYWMFGLMSKGVRCEFEESFEAKGMPEDAGYYTRDDNQLYITDTGNEEDCCTIEKAKQWESYGGKITYEKDIPKWVTHPDWHSHTWLTIEEYERVIDSYNKKAGAEPEPEYEAVLAAMKKLAELGNDVRIVLWFDN
jgi:hypothetical protein